MSYRYDEETATGIDGDTEFSITGIDTCENCLL